MRRRSPPHWWPANEPWPPRQGRHAWHGDRSRFVRRAGCSFAVLLFLGIIGAITLLSWLAAGAGSRGQLFHLPPLAAGVVAAVFVLGVLRVGLSRWGVPVGNIIEASGRVAQGDLSVRLPEHGPVSVRTVARAFNSMTARLEAQDAHRRHLMADIAHELRTPLTVLQGRLEGMVDGVYPRDDAHIAGVLDDAHMLGRLVEDLRTLANAEGGTLALQKESTDLSLLLEDVVRSFSAAADAATVRVQNEVGSELPVMDIDPIRVKEIVSNLLSNALHHTPPGGVVSVAAQHEEGTVSVSVSDTGSGIAADALPKIFDRFHKGQGSRGSGLGLTIARNLVAAHGGEIRAESAPGKGTTIAFTLPVSSSS